ncbi:2-oxoglutarate ferredoxin oxidoreductase subunit beta [Fusobacterium sp. PH5-7]|uniref:thiamine pyrophosphate-dependent enzyme n=1 Tax=Fusobacterium sp. PH5-7 TaxID=2940528 RepID=UPI00247486D0|nr:thiamine pyrophosphate-dependent enzyme [Fusobacterium sp. PH5-7]MDH6459104.1 2-oxoglutarate ferredoxin oxidoreductase subunit beta [Fusobacterium sp. PH5-7]
MGEIIFKRTEGLTEKETHYCPGCTHGIAHRLVAEVLEEMNELNSSVCVSSVGCSVLSYEYFNIDAVEAAHGRAPAVATGIKRSISDRNTLVFTYQGDGDLASIGLGETMSAAVRGENITIIFMNNAIYGMTGGQMAPTTLEGQKTTTSPYGRDPKTAGLPIKICEVLAEIPSATYIERVTLTTPANVIKAKKAISNAFKCQKEGKGFSLIEIVGTCNVGWGLSPKDAIEWCKNEMLSYFPLGIYKDVRGER